MTDKQFDACMLEINKGNKNALREIYEEYISYIYSVVFNIVKSKESAEDITSDFFIKLWSNSEKYNPGNGHKTYLATIARNMTIDYIRKYKREILTEDFEGDYDEDDRKSGYGALSDAKAKIGAETRTNVDIGENTSAVETEVIENISLSEALEKLKPKEKEVINMKIMGELTFKEIAEIMKVPMGTVTWYYREGIEKLRRYGYE